MQSSSADVG